MSSDDVWAASDSNIPPSTPPIAGTRFPGGELPQVSVMITEILGDLMKNFVGWLQFGVGNLVFVILSLALIMPPYLFLVILPLMSHQRNPNILPGILVMLAGILVAVLLQLPWTNGQYRAMLRYQRGEIGMSVTAPLAEAATDLGSVFALTLMTMAITFVAMLACYVPALFVGALVGLAFPGIVVHRLGAVAAVSQSIRHARQFPGWTFAFWGIGFVILLVGGQVPILGPMLTTPIFLAFQLRAYRQIYGDGDAPVEPSVGPAVETATT
jgi:hypothetical protein